MSTQRLTSSGGGNNHAIQSYYSTEASPYDPSQFQNDEANLTELTHDDNDKSKQSKFKESILLYVATVVMVLARSVDFVLYVRMTKKMRNYEYMLADVFLSLGFCFVSWPVTWFKMYRGTISKEMRTFPSYKFIVMGIMDSLNTLISTIPSALVSGPVNVLMSQSVVFINMVASFFFLHFRYNVYHIGGVLLVMIGIIIDIFPMFANSAGGDDPNAWLWILLLFVANIPAAASNVYKEKYLKEANLDVFYLNSWVALYQFIFGLMSAFTVFIPLPDGSGGTSYVNPANLYEYIWSGIKCFFGFNSVLSDQCEYFWAVFMIFICFNMTYNILLLIVFKRGSSTLAVVASVARLALSNFGFLIKFLAGEAYLAALSPFDIIALVILILGIIIYSLTTEKVAESNDPLLKAYNYCWSFLPSFNRKKNKNAFDDEEDVYH